MKTRFHVLLLSSISLILVVAFQNCGEGYKIQYVNQRNEMASGTAYSDSSFIACDVEHGIGQLTDTGESANGMNTCAVIACESQYKIVDNACEPE